MTTSGFRIGQGFDVHAFKAGNCLTLGGVRIPYTKAFQAHSDGDVLLHAICDAVLGALCLGDIGQHFPDTSEKWRGADSRMLLRAVCAMARDAGYALVNLDATIIAQAPRMSPHIPGMRKNIASDFGVDPERISVKATTTERLGFTGREEGIACQAVCLMERIHA